MIFTDFITNILDKIFGKMLKKYQAKQGQDQRTFISAFPYVFTTIAKNLFYLFKNLCPNSTLKPS